MNFIVLALISVPALIAVIIFILAAKLVMGANAQQIVKGRPTKSRDELRREIKIVRGAMAVIILICAAVVVVLQFL